MYILHEQQSHYDGIVSHCLTSLSPELVITSSSPQKFLIRARQWCYIKRDIVDLAYDVVLERHLPPRSC